MSGFGHYIALHSGSLYSRKESSTITSVPLRQPDEAATGQTRKEPLPPTPPQSLSRFSYLWHCGGYILFAAPAPEVWEPPWPVTPTFSPPSPLSASHRLCNLCWQRPQLTKSTTRSHSNTNRNTWLSVKLKCCLEFHQNITFSLLELTDRHSIYSLNP